MQEEAKEIRNDLVSILGQVDIRQGSRGEDLGIETLINLSNKISEYLGSRKT
jgi:hypothetical protein